MRNLVKGPIQYHSPASPINTLFSTNKHPNKDALVFRLMGIYHLSATRLIQDRLHIQRRNLTLHSRMQIQASMGPIKVQFNLRKALICQIHFNISPPGLVLNIQALILQQHRHGLHTMRSSNSSSNSSSPRRLDIRTTATVDRRMSGGVCGHFSIT
jgi:hypothetical protein